MSFKLYFKYGVMGCSKSAQALMTKFNYEQQGYNVLLMKSSLDTRDKKDGRIVVKSRIGLESDAFAFTSKTNFVRLFKSKKAENYGVIIVDECQFCTEAQINQLKELTKFVPVLCYGLKTDFRTKLFEGSKRLLEIADSLTELKAICACGRKATINARFSNGRLVTRGSVIEIGGDERYKAICYDCYLNLKKEQKKNTNSK
ncbi:MAG: thymidine kinase [Clostridia bacterium]|nr:thymidine kinase [Clostridia bacterium]